LLRIEDTDKNREVEGSTDNIVEMMKWAGLEWDEGPGSKMETKDGKSYF
jgi:glutamyl-tRNA synthetase